jgi:formate hydrogenlyase subunit 4
VQTLIQILIILILPPFLLGVINRAKAFFGGRNGPPLLQLYFDLWRLFRKGSVFSTTTTWIFQFAPVVGLITVLLALGMVPLANPEVALPGLSFSGDLVLFAYLLALGRFFTVLAALDTGSPFEGMGAAREVTFACFGETSMFFCLLVLAKTSGSLRLAEIFGFSLTQLWGLAGTSLGLITVSWFILLLAENCRIPVDDPNTHLELTMIHEVLVLDHSGPALGAILYGAALKLFLFAALIVRMTVPLETGNWAVNWVIFIGALLFVAVLVGVVESVMARLRMPAVPSLLVAAGVLSAFSFLLLVSAL